ncbi:MAG: glycosyltransferase family 2 protein, partial [Candidatus Magasanikbacteria bacterium]|nr:glycosyltransferase family 2 protein [Candidatus Magasanikbacteria bacterium]
MISVIVPTHNRVKALQNCLISLFSQTLSPQEIIVVNDGSDDGTKNYLLGLGVKIKVINHEKNLGQSAARNSGIKIAKGDTLVFIDDDCTAKPDWLEQIQKTFEQTPTAEVVIGKTIYVAENYKSYFPERIVGNNNGTWPGSGNIAYK